MLKTKGYRDQEMRMTALDNQRIMATEAFELQTLLIQLLLDRQVLDATEVTQRIRVAADRLATSGLQEDAAAAAHLTALADMLAATYGRPPV